LCFIQQPTAYGWSESRRAKIEQLPTVHFIEALEAQLGESCIEQRSWKTFPDGQQHHDRIRFQSAGDERKDIARRPIEPVGILCDQNDRGVVSEVSKSIQGRESDEEQIRWCRAGPAKRGGHRFPLPNGQGIDDPLNRSDQLMQSGEWQACL
jgi:hypothetical protein